MHATYFLTSRKHAGVSYATSGAVSVAGDADSGEGDPSEIASVLIGDGQQQYLIQQQQ